MHMKSMNAINLKTRSHVILGLVKRQCWHTIGDDLVHARQEIRRAKRVFVDLGLCRETKRQGTPCSPKWSGSGCFGFLRRGILKGVLYGTRREGQRS